MHQGLVIANALAFPVFYSFIVIDTFALSFYQRFFGAVLFMICVGMALLAQLVDYTMNEKFDNPHNAESSQQTWKVRSWIAVLVVEYVQIMLALWFWYASHKNTRSSVDVSFPYHQHMRGYVDWLVVQRYTVALLLLHAIMFGKFWPAQRMYVASMREGMKEM